MRTEDGIESLAETFSFYRHHYANVSPLYERFSEGISKDRELLELAMACQHTPVPNIFLAAVQFLMLKGVAHPLSTYFQASNAASAYDDEAFSVFRDFCLQQRKALRSILEQRICQTNEVRRCAVLLPAMATVSQQAGNRALALVEIGASAGLNLLWDQYSYDYGLGTLHGLEASPVRITCELRGHARPPLPPVLPRVANRAGLDLHPIDIADPDEALWLRSLIWFGQFERVELLERAIAHARGKVPPLSEGDARRLLPELLSTAPHDAALVAYHSFTLNQFSQAMREEIESIFIVCARQRPIWRISVEWIGLEHPEIRLVRYEQNERTETLLGICGGHGHWLEWL